MDNGAMLWDVFCRVIDNFGDIGVCWRLCADLAARGHRMRLWTDDASALDWMAPGARAGAWPGVQVQPWELLHHPVALRELECAAVWVEGFGCEIPEPFLAHFCGQDGAPPQAPSDAAVCQPAWVNLEYLSAEAYVEKSHALASPVAHGPARGRGKYFYYPGFTPGTGGLLREPGLLQDRARFSDGHRRAFLLRHGLDWHGQVVLSLFCYEPPALMRLLQNLRDWNRPVALLVTDGRARAACTQLLGTGTQWGALQLVYLPAVSQADYDRLLWSCDLNFVRGEDSLVRAIWADRAFVWQIYPQDDGAHAAKLECFLGTVQAGARWREFHRLWNGLAGPEGAPQCAHAPSALDLTNWQRDASAARAQLLQMDDLGSQLVQFVQNKR